MGIFLEKYKIKKEEKTDWLKNMEERMGIPQYNTIPEEEEQEPFSFLSKYKTQVGLGIGATATTGISLTPKPLIEGLPISEPEDKSKLTSEQKWQTIMSTDPNIDIKQIPSVIKNKTITDFKTWKEWFTQLKESKDKWGFLHEGKGYTPDTGLKNETTKNSMLASKYGVNIDEWVPALADVTFGALLVANVASVAQDVVNRGVKIKPVMMPKEEVKKSFINIMKSITPKGTISSELSDNDLLVAQYFRKWAGQGGTPDLLKSLMEQKGGLEIPQAVNIFGDRLRMGISPNDIVKYFSEVGKLTTEMQKGLDLVKVSQVTQQLLNVSPVLATEFLKAVEKPEAIPKAEVKEPWQMTKKEFKENVYYRADNEITNYKSFLNPQEFEAIKKADDSGLLPNGVYNKIKNYILSKATGEEKNNLTLKEIYNKYYGKNWETLYQDLNYEVFNKNLEKNLTLKGNLVFNTLEEAKKYGRKVNYAKNIVPYLGEKEIYLSKEPGGVGNVYHIENPKPLGLFDIKVQDIRKEIIIKALAEGKPVPTEVLADYPELKAEVREPVIPKELNLLAEETKKYKTEEEWEKAIYSSELKTIPKAPAPYNQMGNVVELTKSAGFKSIQDFYNQVTKAEPEAPTIPELPKVEEPKKVELAVEKVPRIEPEIPEIPSYTPYEKMNMLKTGARVIRLKALYGYVGEGVKKVNINGKVESIDAVIKRTQEASNLPELEKASEEVPKVEVKAPVTPKEKFMAKMEEVKGKAGLKAEGKAQVTIPITEKTIDVDEIMLQIAKERGMESVTGDKDMLMSSIKNAILAGDKSIINRVNELSKGIPVTEKTAEEIKAYHGTTAKFEEFNIDKIDVNDPIIDRFIGVHFAKDPEIAKTFIEGKEKGEIKEVILDIKNPYQLPQVGNKSDQHAFQVDMAKKVFPYRKDLFVKIYSKIRSISERELSQIYDDIISGKKITNPQIIPYSGYGDQFEGIVENYGLLVFDNKTKKELVVEYRKQIKALGYDAIQYQNTAPMEIGKAKDKTSYIIFDKSQIKPVTEKPAVTEPAKVTTEPEVVKEKVIEAKEEVIPPIKPPIPPSPPTSEMTKEPIGDPIVKLNELIKQAKPLRGHLETEYTKERAKRIAEVERVIDEIGGEKGYIIALSKLKGELAPGRKAMFEPVKDKLSKPELDALYNRTFEHPYLDEWEKISAANELTKILTGEIPTPKGLVLLEEIYGTNLIKSILSKRALGLKITDVLIDIANIPRAILATADMSGFLRQGVVYVASHPVIAAKAMGKTFKFAFSNKTFEQYFKDLPKDKLYPLMRKSELPMTDPSRALASGLEEAFISRLMQKIPILGQIIKFAERGYVGFLTKLRVDVFKLFANEFLSEGFSPVKDIKLFKSTAEVVSVFTGRGSLGSLNRITPLLNTTFFSPRLIAARFKALNPIWYARQPKPIRVKAIGDFAKFVAVGLTLLVIIKASGLGDVEPDPRSSDFGKIRIGNTRWDIWGGFQQWVRVFSQLITGQRKNTATGEIISLSKEEYPFTTRKEVLLRFIEGKLAPVPALINELISGAKTFTGEDITFETVVKEKFIPMYIQDIADAYADGGFERAVGAGVTAFFGVGVQTWEEKKQKAPIGSFLNKYKPTRMTTEGNSFLKKYKK